MPKATRKPLTQLVIRLDWDAGSVWWDGVQWTKFPDRAMRYTCWTECPPKLPYVGVKRLTRHMTRYRCGGFSPGFIEPIGENT